MAEGKDMILSLTLLKQSDPELDIYRVGELWVCLPSSFSVYPSKAIGTLD